MTNRKEAKVLEFAKLFASLSFEYLCADDVGLLDGVRCCIEPVSTQAHVVDSGIHSTDQLGLAQRKLRCWLLFDLGDGLDQHSIHQIT